MFNATAKHTLNVNRVIKKMDDADRRILYRIGGYTRTTARRSLRVRKNAYSRPGDPPRIRSKDSPLRKVLNFRVQERDRSVVIGPELTRSRFNAAKIQEFGGVIHRKAGRVLIPKKEVRNIAGPDRENPRRVEGNNAVLSVFLPATRKYPERPYMGPARDVAAKAFPEMFAGEVGR